QSMGLEVVGFDILDGNDVRYKNIIETFIANQNAKGEPIHRILHLAAIARFAEADKDPLLAAETNAGGTQNVAVAAEGFRIPVVYASTGSVYMPVKNTPPITEEFPATGNSVY